MSDDPTSARVDPVVTFDDLGVHLDYGTRSGDVTWDELTLVMVITTDAGPLVDDVYLLLAAGDDPLVIPNGAAGVEDLLPRLQELPGFDNETFIRAMASAEDEKLVVWVRDQSLR